MSNLEQPSRPLRQPHLDRFAEVAVARAASQQDYSEVMNRAEILERFSSTYTPSLLEQQALKLRASIMGNQAKARVINEELADYLDRGDLSPEAGDQLIDAYLETLRKRAVNLDKLNDLLAAVEQEKSAAAKRSIGEGSAAVDTQDLPVESGGKIESSLMSERIKAEPVGNGQSTIEENLPQPDRRLNLRSLAETSFDPADFSSKDAFERNVRNDIAGVLHRDHKMDASEVSKRLSHFDRAEFTPENSAKLAADLNRILNNILKEVESADTKTPPTSPPSSPPPIPSAPPAPPASRVVGGFSETRRAPEDLPPLPVDTTAVNPMASKVIADKYDQYDAGSADLAEEQRSEAKNRVNLNAAAVAPAAVDKTPTIPRPAATAAAEEPPLIRDPRPAPLDDKDKTAPTRLEAKESVLNKGTERSAKLSEAAKRVIESYDQVLLKLSTVQEQAYDADLDLSTLPRYQELEAALEKLKVLVNRIEHLGDWEPDAGLRQMQEGNTIRQIEPMLHAAATNILILRSELEEITDPKNQAARDMSGQYASAAPAPLGQRSRTGWWDPKFREKAGPGDGSGLKDPLRLTPEMRIKALEAERQNAEAHTERLGAKEAYQASQKKYHEALEKFYTDNNGQSAPLHSDALLAYEEFIQARKDYFDKINSSIEARRARDGVALTEAETKSKDARLRAVAANQLVLAEAKFRTELQTRIIMAKRAEGNILRSALDRASGWMKRNKRVLKSVGLAVAVGSAIVITAPASVTGLLGAGAIGAGGWKLRSLVTAAGAALGSMGGAAIGQAGSEYLINSRQSQLNDQESGIKSGFLTASLADFDKEATAAYGRLEFAKRNQQRIVTGAAVTGAVVGAGLAGFKAPSVSTLTETLTGDLPAASPDVPPLDQSDVPPPAAAAGSASVDHPPAPIPENQTAPPAAEAEEAATAPPAVDVEPDHEPAAPAPAVETDPAPDPTPTPASEAPADMPLPPDHKLTKDYYNVHLNDPAAPALKAHPEHFYSVKAEPPTPVPGVELEAAPPVPTFEAEDLDPLDRTASPYFALDGYYYIAQSNDNMWDIMEGQSMAGDMPVMKLVPADRHQELIKLIETRLNKNEALRHAIGFGDTASDLPLGAYVDVQLLDKVATDIAVENYLVKDIGEAAPDIAPALDPMSVEIKPDDTLFAVVDKKIEESYPALPPFEKQALAAEGREYLLGLSAADVKAMGIESGNITEIKPGTVVDLSRVLGVIESKTDDRWANDALPVPEAPPAAAAAADTVAASASETINGPSAPTVITPEAAALAEAEYEGGPEAFEKDFAAYKASIEGLTKGGLLSVFGFGKTSPFSVLENVSIKDITEVMNMSAPDRSSVLASHDLSNKDFAAWTKALQSWQDSGRIKPITPDMTLGAVAKRAFIADQLLAKQT